MKKRKSLLRNDKIGYLLIAPFGLFFVIFIIAPLLTNLVLSFTNYDLFTCAFIGLKNYRNLFTDQIFLKSIKNTFVYTFFALLLTMGGGLIAATALNRKITGMVLYRTCFYVPYITSMACASMIWLWIFEPSMGILNLFLKQLDIPAKQWLFDVDLAMGCLILVSFWKGIGYNMVIYLAGLQGIPGYLYEAASIDGASFYQKFRYITFPMLRPVTFFLLITGFIGSFNTFEQIVLMTKGGPMFSTMTIAYQIYDRAFNSYLIGYSASMAVVLLVVISIITAINYWYGRAGTEIELG